MQEKDQRDKLNVVIAGAGLVGATAACFLASKGHDVKIYEKGTDPRTWSEKQARSINLTLSPRGQKALDIVDLENRVLECGMLATGRIVHDPKGNQTKSPYNEKGEGIVSLRRTQLNSLLINAALKYPTVKIFFCHELIECDHETGKATFRVSDGKMTQEVDVKADLIIGADGAHSAVREQMFKKNKLELFQQQYHDHGYMELVVPAGKNGKMNPKMLNIWPRGEFMLITFPNQDGTFSGTLFMPFPKFEEVTKSQEVFLEFFRSTFPDLVRLVGEKELIHHFMEREDRRPSRLISNKCQPYHVGDKVVIIGDAAHAMVPFFGQGMNSGFEDCQILDRLLDKYGHKKENLGKVLKEFSAIRCKDGHAICDMAFEHYIELRSDIAGLFFYLRKFVDNMLFRFFPKSWIPRYTMVAFTQMPYHKCQEETERQQRVIARTLVLFLCMFFVAILAIGLKLWVWQ